MENLKILPLNPFLKGLCTSVQPEEMQAMWVVLSVRSQVTLSKNGRTRFDRVKNPGDDD
jgi:hypothetical protein